MFRWIIVHEDNAIRGTNDEQRAKEYGSQPCCTAVVDTQENKIMFEGTEAELEEDVTELNYEDQEEQDGINGVAEREG